MPTPARVAAFRALQHLRDPWSTLGEALATYRDTLHDPRDRALATEIVTGALRWQALLDHLIAHAANRASARIDADVLIVVRLAAFQLLFLDRVPPRAAVNDAVDLVRAVGRASAAGFVNAVLRRLSRDGRSPLPERPAWLAHEPQTIPPGPARDDFLAYASTTLSHPRWLVERWLDRYGAVRTERWLSFNNQPAQPCVHPNWRRVDAARLAVELAREHVITEPCRFAPHALTVVDGRLAETDAWRTHRLWVQDEASQIVAWLPDVCASSTALDACAAPGGKTLLLAERMQDRGLLVAGDARPRRLLLLRQTLAQHGATSIPIVGLDLTRPLPFRRGFDCVIVDAPCSGLGTLRRDPELRWRRRESELATFASMQVGMLRHASAAVEPGGQLLYATCSSEPDENVAVVDAFLDECPHFRRESDRLPALAPGLFDAAGDFVTRPFDHELEAFFAARLRRRA